MKYAINKAGVKEGIANEGRKKKIHDEK